MRLFNVISTRFENFDDTVKAYLQKAMSSIGVNYKSSQIFGVILNAVKGVIQNAMFYIEDALTEQNIFTAVRKKSIYNLAKISGYTPFYGKAATGTAIISTKSGNDAIYSTTSSTTKLYITNSSQLRNTNNGLVYTISMPTDDYVIDVSKPLVKHEFKIVEGTYYYAQYTAQGYLFETFDVGVNGMWDDDYIEVTVNGEEYTRAGSVYDAGSDDNVYIIRNGYDSLFSISFGNGTYGRCLKEGDTVKVKYLKHNGTTGNISTENISDGQFMFDTGLYDSAGNWINPINYINIEINANISGGTDADTIKEVKNSIGAESRSLVYVTPENFMLFLRRFNFVGWCNVITESNSLSVSGMCLHNMNNLIIDSNDYYNINKSDLLLTEHEKKMITETLENSGKLYAGIQFSLSDPIIRQFAVVCYVKLIDSTTNRDSATERIRAVFADYFININKSKLFIPKSAIIVKIMDECSDIVESVDFDFISETNESAYKNGYYTKSKQEVNGSYYTVNATYETDKTALIDDFGNIQLDTDAEIAFLHGDFKYYPNKKEDDRTKADVINDIHRRNDVITLTNAVQIYYI